MLALALSAAAVVAIAVAARPLRAFDVYFTLEEIERDLVEGFERRDG